MKYSTAYQIIMWFFVFLGMVALVGFIYMPHWLFIIQSLLGFIMARKAHKAHKSAIERWGE